jgi:uncharacterized protein (TIGR03435 family)
MGLRILKSQVLVGAILLGWLSLYSPPALGIETGPHFEVAAIKPSDLDHSPQGWISGVRITGAKFEARRQSAVQLIKWAYDLESSKEILDAPRWASDRKFDIVAVLELGDPYSYKELSSSAQEQLMRQAMKSLLGDRFGLKLHTEKRNIPVYALEKEKNFEEPDVPALLKQSLADGGRNPQTFWPSSTGMWWSPGYAQGYAVTVRQIILQFLAVQPECEDRPIVDHSHISTTISFKLKWAPQGRPDIDDPPLLTALRDQAGLRIVSARENMDVLVVDHIDTPTPN